MESGTCQGAVREIVGREGSPSVGVHIAASTAWDADVGPGYTGSHCALEPPQNDLTAGQKQQTDSDPVTVALVLREDVVSSRYP